MVKEDNLKVGVRWTSHYRTKQWYYLLPSCKPTVWFSLQWWDLTPPFFLACSFYLSGNCYCFKCHKKHKYQLLREYAVWQNAGLTPQLAFFSAVAPVDLVPLPPCNDLLQATINTAHPDDLGKNQFLCQLRCLHSNTGMHGCSSAQNLPYTWSAHQTETLSCVTSQASDKTKACGGMLERDIIEPSTSLYATPVVLVPRKHNSKPRFCVDYRNVSAATHTAAYPLPNNQ